MKFLQYYKLLQVKLARNKCQFFYIFFSQNIPAITSNYTSIYINSIAINRYSHIN